MIKDRLNISISGRVLDESEISILLEECKDNDLKEAIKLAYYKGFKLKEIKKLFNDSRRTLQRKISKLGKEVLKMKLCFEMLRTSCMIRLFNQGYTGEYINKFMKYSRKDTLIVKRLSIGYISPKLRFDILTKDNFKCVLCGNEKELEVDHITPISKGGKSIKKNLRTLCKKCNVGRINNNESSNIC